jgi:hypothetical protein
MRNPWKDRLQDTYFGSNKPDIYRHRGISIRVFFNAPDPGILILGILLILGA